MSFSGVSGAVGQRGEAPQRVVSAANLGSPIGVEMVGPEASGQEGDGGVGVGGQGEVGGGSS